MNELHLENGFKIYITLQVSKKQSSAFALNRACMLLEVTKKINYALHFQLIYVLYIYFKTQEILNSLKLTLPQGIPQTPQL